MQRLYALTQHHVGEIDFGIGLKAAKNPVYLRMNAFAGLLRLGCGGAFGLLKATMTRMLIQLLSRVSHGALRSTANPLEIREGC